MFYMRWGGKSDAVVREMTESELGIKTTTFIIPHVSFTFTVLYIDTYI